MERDKPNKIDMDGCYIMFIKRYNEAMGSVIVMLRFRSEVQR